MPAPDLPPAPQHHPKERALAVHLLARLYKPEAFSGCVAIVVDALRASTTITQALAAGATRVYPTLTVDEARALKTRADLREAVLGGERGGVRIEGFDLGNSPLEYTRERVGGRPVVFTTTNGTAALLHAARAARVLVGSLSNLSALCGAVAKEPRPVHILCAGTRDEVSLDDCLPAGAMVELLLGAGRHLVADDSGQLCLRAWRGAAAGGAGGIIEAMKTSRGGRGLVTMGFGADVEFCATRDTTGVIPAYDAEHGAISAWPGA